MGSRQRDFMAKVANLNIYFTYIIKFIEVKILIIKILCLLKMYMTMRSNAKAKNRSHPLAHPKIREAKLSRRESHSFPQFIPQDTGQLAEKRRSRAMVQRHHPFSAHYM